MPSPSGGKGAYLKYVTDPHGKKVQNMPYKIEKSVFDFISFIGPLLKSTPGTIAHKVFAYNVSRADRVECQGREDMILVAGVRSHHDCRAFYIFCNASVEFNAVLFRVLMLQGSVYEEIEYRVYLTYLLFLLLFTHVRLQYRHMNLVLRGVMLHLTL